MDKDNLIKLLGETLKFYADQANYVNDQINKDQGHQARFILDLVAKNEQTITTYEKEFEEAQKVIEESISPEDAINQLKNFAELINKQNGR
jgi:hypothetical protein